MEVVREVATRGLFLTLNTPQLSQRVTNTTLSDLLYSTRKLALRALLPKSLQLSNLLSLHLSMLLGGTRFKS